MGSRSRSALAWKRSGTCGNARGCRGEAAGFTLIEVLVALTIGSLVVLMVHQAFGATADLSARLDTARATHRTRMDAIARLTQVFGSLEVGTAGSTGFQGRQQSAEFTTTVERTHRRTDAQTHGRTDAPAPSGASARPVRVSVESGQLILQRRRSSPESLLTADAIAFDYLLSYGAESSWVREWHSPVSAPLAVRMRLRRAESVDTLFFFIGPRG